MDYSQAVLLLQVQEDFAALAVSWEIWLESQPKQEEVLQELTSVNQHLYNLAWTIGPFKGFGKMRIS
jgi:hypothetical protein